MHYIDTSILAAYYCPEPLSEQAEALLLSGVRQALSSLSEVELLSAVSRKMRAGEISPAHGRRIANRFGTHLEGDFYTRLPVEQRHYRIARDWIGSFRTTLRTLDALHLAVASVEGLCIATADSGLFDAAVALGLEARLIRQIP